jgi:hypothetical protein
MKMTHQPIVRKTHEGRTIGVVGDVYRFLATGEDTNGNREDAGRRPPIWRRGLCAEGLTLDE